VLSDDLRDLEIPEIDYAYGIITLLESWRKKRNFRCIPINVFCGEWAFGRFLKIYEQEYAKIHSLEGNEIILQNELLFAKCYISKNINGVVRKSGVIAEMNALLSDEWRLANEENSRPIQEVLELLFEEYGLKKHPTSYDDITKELRCRQ
jgi:hypothetical protein